MKKENGQLPEGLKELSAVAIAKQILINEALEEISHSSTRFLRLFNGGSMDPEMIKERAQQVLSAMDHAKGLLSTITKPYLD